MTFDPIVALGLPENPLLAKHRVTRAPCRKCGADLDFGTDWLGRTVQSCRTCGLSELVPLTVGAVVEKPRRPDMGMRRKR